jgi:ABC-2 type transport system permease protein
MTRYVRIWGAQFRASVAAAMQYRANFVIELTVGLAWNALSLLPLLVLFDQRESVAGWDRPSALMVMAYFMAVNAVLEGVIGPSLVQLINGIRTGSFDYVLLKPADAQFLVTATTYAPEKVFSLLAAIAIAVYAFAERGHGPRLVELALGLGLFLAGVIAVSSLWIACAAITFWVVRLESLLHLLGSVFDAARWPVHVYRGVWRIVLTFVIPLAIMTTFPAMAMLGRLDARTATATVAGVLATVVISRLVWRTAIRNYTSASS